MPLTPSYVRSAPHARLAWDISLAVVALEKLQKGLPKEEIDAEEREAVNVVTREVRSLAKACQVNTDDLLEGKVSLPKGVRDSLSTLLAIEGDDVSSRIEPILPRTEADLDAISRFLSSDQQPAIDSAVVSRTQEACLTILNQLNRPLT
jgi:hypothetical protein